MPDAAPLRPGDPTRVGDYDILGLLGEGGQGAVYLGRRAGGGPGDAHVAVKLLHDGLTADHPARARFVRELLTAKQVARFCTAQVLDADLDGDRPYIVSEYVEGLSLYASIHAEGPRTGGALERLAISTLTALAAIHQAGIMHRDFKPRNIVLGIDGPRVIDFGIARALGAANDTQTVGTPSYMAPEQVAGHDFGPPADMFAWGSTMVFASTGCPAFGDDDTAAVMHRIVTSEPDLGELTGQLREVVAACLSKAPEDRPTAQEAQRMLMGSATPAIAVDTVDEVDDVEGMAGPGAWSVPADAFAGTAPAANALPDEPAAIGEPFSAGTPGAGPGAVAPAGLPVPSAAAQPLPDAFEVMPAPPIVYHMPDGPSGPPAPGTTPASAPVSEQPAAAPPYVSPYVSPYAPPSPESTAFAASTPFAVPTPPAEAIPFAGAAPLAEAAPAAETSRQGVGEDLPAQPPRYLPGQRDWLLSGQGRTGEGRRRPILLGAGACVVALLVAGTAWAATHTGASGEGRPGSTEAAGLPGSPASGGSGPSGAQDDSLYGAGGTGGGDSAAATTASPRAGDDRSGEPRTDDPEQPGGTTSRTGTGSSTGSSTGTGGGTSGGSTAARPPSSTKPANPPSRPNPYTAAQVCNTGGHGSGYYVQRSSAFTGGRVYQLYNSSGYNCVVTLKTTYVGQKTSVWAQVTRQDGGKASDSGSFAYYAGPVFVYAKGQCVKYAGGGGQGSASAPWGNCG